MSCSSPWVGRAPTWLWNNTCPLQVILQTSLGQESCDSWAAQCSLHQTGLWHSMAPRNHCSEQAGGRNSALLPFPCATLGRIHPRGSCEDKSHPQPGCRISPRQLPGGFSCSSPPPAQHNLPGGARCDPLSRGPEGPTCCQPTEPAWGGTQHHTRRSQTCTSPPKKSQENRARHE